MKEETDFVELLSYLKLPFIRENHKAATRTAAERQRSHIEFLAELVRVEADMRKDRAVKRRIGTAGVPVIKTLEQFDWLWSKKINRPKIFNNDSTLKSALLDRLLHHTEVVVIEGSSYRMKDVVK